MKNKYFDCDTKTKKKCEWNIDSNAFRSQWAHWELGKIENKIFIMFSSRQQRNAFTLMRLSKSKKPRWLVLILIKFLYINEIIYEWNACMQLTHSVWLMAGPSHNQHCDWVFEPVWYLVFHILHSTSRNQFRKWAKNEKVSGLEVDALYNWKLIDIKRTKCSEHTKYQSNAQCNVLWNQIQNMEMLLKLRFQNGTSEQKIERIVVETENAIKVKSALVHLMDGFVNCNCFV